MGLDGLLLNGLQLSERETSSDPIFNVPQKGEKSTSKISLPGPGEPKIGSLGDKFRQIAEKAGAQVVYADLPEGVNGLYRHGIIAISKSAPNQALETAKHELTHHLENSGYYSDFAAFIKKELRGRGYDVDAAIKEIREDYGKKGIVLDEDGGSREFVAKFTEEFLFRDEASIERLARENPNLFQRIYEWIRGTLAKVGIGKDSWFLWEAQKKYEKALRNVGEIKDRGTQFSISDTLKDDLEKVLTGSFRSQNNEVYIGETSNFLTEVIQAEPLQVTMPPNKAYSAMVTEQQARLDGRYEEGTNYHGLGSEGLLRVLEKSENPVAAFAATADENGKRIGRIVLVTDETGRDGNLVVVEDLSARGRLDGRRINANKVITSYDRAAVAGDILQAALDGRLLNLDKKRSQTIFAGVPASNSPGAIRNVDFKQNIQNFWEEVKWNRTQRSRNSSEECPV